MILVALGANLPAPDSSPPIETCRRAVRRLAGLGGVGGFVLSRWYETTPVPRADQPNYVNGVVRFEGSADPAWLLSQLHAIEAASGRVRGAPNAARTLDLDIIDIDGLVRDDPDPVLPHPRAHLRGFVLVPLAEVAPNWLHPRLRQSVGDLLRDLPRQEVRLLAPP